MPGVTGWLDRFRSGPIEEDNQIETEVSSSETRLSKNILKDRISQDLILQYRSISNLTQLNQITLENVLNCLVERFYSRTYYTFAGSVLISLNPCFNVNRRQSLNSIECRTKYKLDEDDVSSVGQNLPPHVYSVGLRSLKNLKLVGNNQVIVVSGESGAGKTTATQQLIDYFTKTKINDHLENMTISDLEKKIYLATTVLESFGNASTRSNPNSSRFGRLVELKYDNTKSIVGAEIKTYLLEKHRVAKIGPKERNFHIFYYLLSALENGKLSFEDLSSICCEEGLSTYLVEAVQDSDEENYDRLSDALQKLQVGNEFLEVYRIVFAIMHLLDVEFIEDTSQDEDDEDNNCASNQEFILFPEDLERVSVACSILGLKGTSLVDSFIAKKLTLGQNKRYSIYRKVCTTKEECKGRVKAFITFLYNNLFNYVLSLLNTLVQKEASTLASNSSKKDQELGAGDNNRFYTTKSRNNNLSPIQSNVTSTLSLLDLYGFENLQYNHLEQMCINYANERLQQLQISALKKYFEEEKKISEIEINFSQPTELNRVEQEIINRVEDIHSIIFSVLDEECLLGRSNTDEHIFQRIGRSLNAKNEKSKFISMKQLAEKDCPFVIKHYATDVTYSMEGMPEKNKDFVPPEFAELFQSSRNSFVRSLFPCSNNVNSTPLKNADRGKTILTRFKSSVNGLLSELQNDENKELHFIRCIRPNTDLTQGKVEVDVVRNQLYACGIVDVIHIAGNGYPIRMPHKKFRNEFPKILHSLCRGQINALTSIGSSNTHALKVGSSTVFMNEKSWLLLKKIEAFVCGFAIKKLQRGWRGYISWKKEEALRLQTLSPISLDSCNTTLYFTPGVMESEDDNSVLNSTHLIVVPFDEDLLSSDSETIYHSDDGSTLLGEQVEGISQPTKFRDPAGVWPKNLIYGDGIVSRSPIHTQLIKIYTKTTALGRLYPRRLTANGIQDAFEDYSILSWDSEIEQRTFM